MSYALEIEGVSHWFGSNKVLNDINLQIADGQIVAVVGPSGCGKSTLLKLMIGLIEPSTGSVRFEGEELTRSNVLECRRRMGYVLQEGGLFPHLSARANVTLMARYLGQMSRAQIDDRTLELAVLTHFPQEALDRYPLQISGGQRQRGAILRALMLEPEVMLLDEPMGALDPMIRFRLQEDLRPIFQTLKKTVVLVTHDMAEAGFFSDDVILLREGRIVQRGTLNDMLTKPADPWVLEFIEAQRGLPRKDEEAES